MMRGKRFGVERSVIHVFTIEGSEELVYDVFLLMTLILDV